MSRDILKRLRKLLATIHDESERLLATHKVYGVSDYAWSGEDTVNEEFTGHAMWQMDPPFEPEWQPLMNGGNVTYEPTERDELLLRNGEDFVGTMEFARRSLGMALCYAVVAVPKSHIFENRELWHEYANTLQWLNIASDRLRDYFLMARFGQTDKEYAKSYKKNNKGNPPFAAPFQESLEGAPDNIGELLNRLSSIAPELQTQRKDRNSIVHEVATQAAKVSLKILREQRDFAQSGKPIQFPAGTYEDLQAHIASIPDDPLATEITNMKLWYTHLVKASSLVFEFEHFNRNQPR